MDNATTMTVEDARAALAKDIATLARVERLGFDARLIALANDSISDSIDALVNAVTTKASRAEQAGLAEAASIVPALTKNGA